MARGDDDNSSQGSKGAFLKRRSNSDGDIEANTNRGASTTTTTARSGGRFDNMEFQVDCSKCCDTVPKKWAWAIFVGLIFVIGIVLLGLSLKKLDSTEYGLEYHPRRKELDEAAKSGGLHIGPPGFKFVKFPKTFIVSIRRNMPHPPLRSSSQNDAPFYLSDGELERRKMRFARWTSGSI